MSVAGSIDYRGSKFDIYDAKYNYNVSSLPALNITDPTQLTEVIQLFTIPSIRYFYLSKRTNPVTKAKYLLPYLASITDDVVLWKKYMDPEFFNVTVYSQKAISYINQDVEETFYSILDGNTIIASTTNYLEDYIYSLFIKMNLFVVADQESEIYKEQKEIIKIFVKGGLNEASDYISAIEHSFHPIEEDIQRYLDDIGIITFTAKSILNLSPSKIFFYLVHFFGPPYENNLAVGSVVRSFEVAAKTELAIRFAKQIEANYDTYSRPIVKKNFGKVFTYANSDVTPADAMNYLKNIFQTNNFSRILNGIFDYLILFENEKSNTLTFKVLKGLFGNGKTPDVAPATIIDTLKRMYTDAEIMKIVPAQIDDEEVNDYPSRNEFVDAVVTYWHENRIRLLNKSMSDVCAFSESIIRCDDFCDMAESFIGYGSLQNKIYCYTIDDFLHHFMRSTDAEGYTEFTFPVQKIPMTISDLNNILAIVESMEDTTFEYYSETIRDRRITKAEFINTLNNYIDKARLQESDSYLRPILVYAQQSQENRARVKNLFLAFFELGMYYRQWRGPGTPYPLTSGFGTEPAPGTSAEIALAAAITPAVDKFNRILNELPDTIKEIVNALKIYVKDNGQTNHRQYTYDHGTPATLQPFHALVTAGGECIRMSSRPYFYSAAYYLKKILNEDIAGFPLDAQVQAIY